MADEIVVLVTTSSEAEAQEIGEKLVESKLAACANIVASVQSIFRWQGEIADENETLMIIKSTKARLQAIIEKVKELHSYDVPEIIALPIVAGSEAYLNWIHEETTTD